MSKHHHHHGHHGHHHDHHHNEVEGIIDRLRRSCCENECPSGPHFTRDDAQRIARVLGVNTESPCFDLDEFTKGLNVELEHGLRNPDTNVTNNDPILTGKIALAHLNQIPDYYRRLDRMRREAREDWDKVRRKL